MKKLFALALAFVGIAASGAASMGSVIWWLEEPVAPKSMIK